MHTLMPSLSAAATAVAIALLCAWVWFGQALLNRRREQLERRRSPHRAEPGPRASDRRRPQ
jgi:hypothetical protein